MWVRGALTLLAACGRLGFDTTGDLAPDGDVVAPDAPVAFEVPVPVPGMVNTTSDEAAPSITADGLTLYLASPRVGGFTIWVATRAAVDQPFGSPTRLVELDGAGIEYGAEISADQREMIYNGNMPSQVRRTTRAVVTDAWGAPEVLSLPGTRQGPALTVGDLRLLIGISPNGGIEEYSRPSVSQPWTLVRSHAALAGLLAPTVTSDGLEIYAYTVQKQLVRATRLSLLDEFGTPSRVLFGSEVDSVPITDPELSADNSTLYFIAEIAGDRELYVTTTRQ